MLSQTQRWIWRFGAVAIAAAMVAPAAWGDPNLTDHTAQDPKPPWKIPPGCGGAPFNPGWEVAAGIHLNPTPVSVALRDMGAQSFDPGWSEGWISLPSASRGSTLDFGGTPIGPVPAPGALALLGLSSLVVRTSRRRR